MRRKASTEAIQDEELSAPSEVEDVDPHGFWDGANLSGDAHDEAFAVVIDADGEQTDNRETLAYMGSVSETRIEPDELVALAVWAESKACRLCRRKIREHHDPALLKHDECRTALRAGRLLRRYT
jgi:hypothetical protein